MELLSETWDLQLVKYACVALGEICRSGPLPIKESDEINGVLSKQFIIKKLRMLMKETDDVTVSLLLSIKMFTLVLSCETY